MDIDEAILGIIDQLGFEWTDCGKLIDYIKDNYIKTDIEVVENFSNNMGWKVNIQYLNYEKILNECEINYTFLGSDYNHLGEGLYINIDELENDKLLLQQQDLII